MMNIENLKKMKCIPKRIEKSKYLIILFLFIVCLLFVYGCANRNNISDFLSNKTINISNTSADEIVNTTDQIDEENSDIANTSVADNFINNTTDANITTPDTSIINDNEDSSSNDSKVVVEEPPEIKEETTKKEITSFIYQLQHVNFSELLSENVSLVGIDADEGFTESQIKSLQNSGKIVLSYLSIGEAEKWRNYWKSEWDSNPPFWVGENQSNKESPVVKYWEKEWQELTFSRIDQISTLGYDGFVLDTVDAYYYWDEKEYNKTYTRDEMAEFVKAISAKVKNKNASQLIFVNNAGILLDNQGYLDVIDGMLSEEAFYYNDAPATWSAWDVAFLDKAIAAGKPVLAIDYSTKKELQCDFIKKAKEHGFVPYVTVKELDKIVHTDCS